MNTASIASIPQTIDKRYLTRQSKDNTVGILGSSKSTDEILDYMDKCSQITKALVLGGKNIVHGCGNSGIMGAAYKSAKTYSQKDIDGRPAQNLAIIAKPLWGDEDLENCIPLTYSNSEAERIEKFAQVANTFVIFPGSSTTLQEATTLITKNYYGNPQDKKQIILVGRDFFKGLVEQYQKLYETKLIKCPPEELFRVVDNEDELNKLIK
mgnify:FL=1